MEKKISPKKHSFSNNTSEQNVELKVHENAFQRIEALFKSLSNESKCKCIINRKFDLGHIPPEAEVSFVFKISYFVLSSDIHIRFVNFRVTYRSRINSKNVTLVKN